MKNIISTTLVQLQGRVIDPDTEALTRFKQEMNTGQSVLEYVEEFEREQRENEQRANEGKKQETKQDKYAKPTISVVKMEMEAGVKTTKSSDNVRSSNVNVSSVSLVGDNTEAEKYKPKIEGNYGGITISSGNGAKDRDNPNTCLLSPLDEPFGGLIGSASVDIIPKNRDGTMLISPSSPDGSPVVSEGIKDEEDTGFSDQLKMEPVDPSNVPEGLIDFNSIYPSFPEFTDESD